MQWSRTGTINPHAIVKKERGKKKQETERSHIKPLLVQKTAIKKCVLILFVFCFLPNVVF